MPQGDRKVDEAIEVTYQATGATTGLTDVTMEILDETGAKDGVNFPDVTMSEIADAPGSYKGSFIPDEQGKWRVRIDSTTKPGKVIKDYDVVGHNIHSIGGKLDIIDANIDATESNIRGADNDTLKILSDQIDGITGTIGPMIG